MPASRAVSGPPRSENRNGALGIGAPHEHSAVMNTAPFARLLTLPVALSLAACGGGSAAASRAPEATGGSEAAPGADTTEPIAFTPTPDVSAAGTGPIHGALFGHDATVVISFGAYGGSWSVQLDSAPGTGNATGTFALDGAVASGATLRSATAQRPGFLCDPTGMNRNDSELAYAIEITDAAITACPAGITEQTQIGTASGRIVVVARDLSAGLPDSYLRGSFEAAAVYCFPTE